MRDAILSVNEREFIVKALHEEQRIDGRRPLDARPPQIEVHGDGRAEVQLGDTRALAVVTAELTLPFRDRPSEGIFAVNIELSPMASPQFEAGRPSDEQVELTRMLERGLKQSGAVDTESLVVQAGRWVWSVRVDVHVLDHAGNLAGAISLAALAALLTFRRPEVTISADTGALEVHPAALREPLPLSLHHLPVVVSFAFFDGAGELLLLDPSAAEEGTALGAMTVTVNAQRDVCSVQKSGGVAISAAQLLRCMRLAATQAVALTEALREAVRVHAAKRLAARVRRHRPGDAPAPPADFMLGAKLGADDGGAPEYLAAPDDGSDSDGDAAAAEPEQAWDHVDTADAFPFAGPLRPAAARGGGGADGADELDVDALPLQPSRAMGVAAMEADDAVPDSLLAAVKQPRQKRR